MSLRLAPIAPVVASLALLTACPSSEPPPTEDGGGSSGEAETDTDPGPDSMTSMGSTGQDGTTAEPGTTDEPGSTGGELDPACACVITEDPFNQPGCDLSEECEPVQVGCAEAQPVDCAFEDLTVVNPEVLPCHHDLLVGGGTALLRWELPFIADPGAAGQRGWLLLVGDDRAIEWTEAWGADYLWTDATLSTLQPAAYFDGCMDLATPEETFRCLFDAAAEPVGVCVPEHEIPLG